MVSNTKAGSLAMQVHDTFRKLIPLWSLKMKALGSGKKTGVRQRFAVHRSFGLLTVSYRMFCFET